MATAKKAAADNGETTTARGRKKGSTAGPSLEMNRERSEALAGALIKTTSPEELVAILSGQPAFQRPDGTPDPALRASSLARHLSRARQEFRERGVEHLLPQSRRGRKGLDIEAMIEVLQRSQPDNTGESATV